MADWYERAIVADRLAADELEAMDGNAVIYNAQARSVINHNAAVALGDLHAAREAYTREHRPTGRVVAQHKTSNVADLAT